MKDLYKILGLKSDASLDDIKAAFRTSAKSAHPDKGGTREQMALLNEAYTTLSDKEKRKRFDVSFEASQESDTVVDPGDMLYLGAGNHVPFSKEFRDQHSALVQEFRATPLMPRRRSDDYQPFEANVYSIDTKDGKPPRSFADLFTFIREKSRLQRVASEPVLLPRGPLSPIAAVKFFMEFLAGHYDLTQLKTIKDYFSAEIIKIKRINSQVPELLFYEGILELISITDLRPDERMEPMSAIRKITNFAKEASEGTLSIILPLFYNRFFRALYAQALHLYWLANGNLFTDEHLKQFDGQQATKELLQTLIERISHDSEDEHLIDLVRHIKLLHNFEKAANAIKDSEQDANHFRDQAFHLLDWIPTMQGIANRKMLVNIFLQIGIKFQQASQKERQPALKMADEKLALKMYLSSFTLGHQDATPDTELYANTEVLRYIAAFQYQDPMYKELIPAVQKRTLLIADIFPFFYECQTNITLMREEYKSTHLLRRLLNALVGILEYNKTHSADEAIVIDHAAASILYQAYEACLKNWYQEEYDPTVEKKFRLDLMKELLSEQKWTVGDIEENLGNPWVMVARDAKGWMRPTRSLPFVEDPRRVKYSAINGAQLNDKTGEITFHMQEWDQTHPDYEKSFTLFDLQEMLEKNIAGAIFSLDPVDPNRPYHPFNTMRFGPPQLCETELLNSMLLTDYILKFLTTHQEVQGIYPFEERPLDSMLDHLPEYLRQLIEDFHSAKQNSGALHRFWIEAEKIDISVSDPEATKDGTTKFALGDVNMVVKKHRMERDIHGELKDVGNEDEGWPIYVLTEKEMQALKDKKKMINGPAMIYPYGERKLIYWEHDEPIHHHDIPQEFSETLIRLYKQPRELDGKIVSSPENIGLLYRSTKEMAQQSGLSHRYSPEFVFAHEFTKHYDEFAQYLPEFRRLKELSKIATLIRFLNSVRQANSEQIQALDFLLNPNPGRAPDTESYKRYNQAHQNTREKISAAFQEWRRDGISSAGLHKKWREELNRIKGQIGELNLGSYSAEVEEACQRFFRQVSRDNPGVSSSRIWSEVINPKRSEIASQISQSKRDGYFKQLKELFSPQLALSVRSVEQLVNSFLQGNIQPLLDALANAEKNKIHSQIQKQVPNTSLEDIDLALSGSDAALQKIAKNESRQQLVEQRSHKGRVEAGFVGIGLNEHEEPVNLDGKCLWVPASVRHEVRRDTSTGLSRHSFFVYGGVNIQPRINVVQGNGGSLGGSSVGGGALGTSNTVLYQKVGPDGEHLKFGITKNPDTRYSAAELGGGRLKVIAQGSRQEMLQLERNLHSTLPIGPEERQSAYIGIQVAKGYQAPPYK